MADASVAYGAAQAHAAPVQNGAPAAYGAQPVAQAQPQQQLQQQAAPQNPVAQYAPAPAGSVPAPHPMVATVPVGVPPIPPTIAGNQAPQDPPPRRRARRATPASRGGRTRRAVAAPAPAAAMHPQQGPGAGALPAASMPTGAPAGTMGLAAATLANGGMTQPSTDMWNQYSQAVNEFMSMQSKTIDKLLDRTYTTNHSRPNKKSVQIAEHGATAEDEEELDSQTMNEMQTATNPSLDEATDESEAEMEEKPPAARAKRTRRPAPRKVSSKTSGAKTRQDYDEEDEEEELNDTRQRKMIRNGQAEALRSVTAAPTPGQKRYSDGGAIDLAAYYK